MSIQVQRFARLATDFEVGRFVPVKTVRVFSTEKEAKLTSARPNTFYVFSYRVPRPVSKERAKTLVGKMLMEFRNGGHKVHYIGQQGNRLYVQVQTPKTLSTRSYQFLAVFGLILIAITVWIFFTGASPQFRKGVEGITREVGGIVEKGVTGVGRGVGAGIGEAAKSSSGLFALLGLAAVGVAGGAYVLTRRKR